MANPRICLEHGHYETRKTGKCPESRRGWPCRFNPFRKQKPNREAPSSAVTPSQPSSVE